MGRALQERRIVKLANNTLLVTRDGREIAVEDSAAPIEDAAGQVVGVVLVFRDVTEKHRALRQLREANEELTLFNRAMVGRELRMIELKREINELCRQLGRPGRYPLIEGDGA